MFMLAQMDGRATSTQVSGSLYFCQSPEKPCSDQASGIRKASPKIFTEFRNTSQWINALDFSHFVHYDHFQMQLWSVLCNHIPNFLCPLLLNLLTVSFGQSVSSAVEFSSPLWSLENIALHFCEKLTCVSIPTQLKLCVCGVCTRSQNFKWKNGLPTEGFQ